MTCLRYTIIVILSLYIASEQIDANPHSDTVIVDSAMGYNLDKHYLLLFVGDKVQTLADHVGKVINDRDSFKLPPKMQLQAAYTRRNKPFDRRYFGDEYGVNVKNGVRQKIFEYGPNRKFMRKGGPDAAGKRGGVVYFFKGCEMVVRKSEGKWGRIRKVDSVGLPCNIHAAWAEGDRMVVLRGDEYYNWESDGSVNGPHDFASNYTLIDWTLRPASEL